MALNSGLTEGLEISIEDPFDELDDIDWDDIPILENNVKKTEQQTINMLRDLEAYNEMSKYVEGQTLVDYGYVAPKKLYGRSPEGIIGKLFKLSCDEYPVTDDRILMQKYDVESGSEEVFLVNPVLMAVILEEYEIAEMLIEKGYSVDDRFLEKQIYMEKSRETFDEYIWHDISITQLLFARPEMPEKLRYKICDVLSLIRPVFDYKYDCSHNPFMKVEGATSSGMYRAEKFPLDGFEAIFKTDSELLEGMFTEENFVWAFIGGDIEYVREKAAQIFEKLLVYMVGTEDIRAILKEIARIYLGEFGKIQYLEIWWKLFPKIKKTCEYDEETTDICIELLLEHYIWYSLSGEFSSIINEPLIQKHLKRIEQALRDLCTGDYTQEKLMDYLFVKFVAPVSKNEMQKMLAIINLWKTVLLREWRPMRYDMAFVELLDVVLFYVTDDDRTSKEERKKEECIQNSIDLIELLDGVSYDECPIKEFGYAQADFMNKVMQLESEELFMLCVEKNLIPKELLPIAADAALELGYTKLMPSIIYLQSQKGVC